MRKRTTYPPLIGIEEVAERLGVSTRYVRRLVAERRIAFLKIGHLLRFDVEVVDAWIEACAVNADDGRGLPMVAGPIKPARSQIVAASRRRIAEPPSGTAT